MGYEAARVSSCPAGDAWLVCTGSAREECWLDGGDRFLPLPLLLAVWRGVAYKVVDCRRYFRNGSSGSSVPLS